MAGTTIPSYGTTMPTPSSPNYHDDSDQTLANTPLLQASEDSTRNGYEGHEYDSMPTERSPLVSFASRRYSRDEPVRTNHERGKQSQKISHVLIVTLGSLCLLVVLILFLGFLVPDAAQEYSKQAAVMKLHNISVDSFTSNGVRISVKSQVAIDATRVRSLWLRSLGILVGSIARKVMLYSSDVFLYLPEYPEGMLGTVTFPDLSVSLGNGEITDIDIICNVTPGNFHGVKPALMDYLNGRVRILKVQGESNISLRSGILPLGTHRITQDVIFENIPSIPTVELSRLNLAEIGPPEHKALGANVTVSVENKYPVNISIPPLSFSVLLPSCDREFIEVAIARTSMMNIRPSNPIIADVAGTIQSIPFALIEICPGTGTSPLDDLLGQYVRGDSSTAYIRGLPVDHGNSGLPAWVSDILSSVTIPVPFPGGHAFKDLLKSFSLADVKFVFPDPNAEPGTPEASPCFSATVKAIVSIPHEMNAPLDVSKVVANGDISYHSKKLGEFHFPHWALATTVQRNDSHELEINARVENVPLNITDPDVFSDMLQDIISGGGAGVTLKAVGTADVKVGIASLGAFVVRGIPAQGDVVINGGKYNLDKINPRPNEISIISSTSTSVKLGANVTFNNPTNYTARIPYANIQFTKNETVLGNGTIRDITIGLKENTAVLEAFWAPADGGDLAWATGAALLGDYISGKNTTITLRAHEHSIPSLPDISKALSSLKFDIPLPSLPLDDEGGAPSDPSGRSHFVQSATLHVLSSTGTFVLRNPLKKDTIFMSNLTGIASHNGTILGTLNYAYQFAVPPGVSETPKLPVEWSLNGVGYDIVKKAIGGILKIDAKAHCNVKVGYWEDKLGFEGNGIGAHVAL
ncbi:hypothetical protein TWF694_001607 [Orbilia ellipsospora]|uniref:Pre-rRNA processing protein n=1 Tax=Orbilia ellipsospora TaxID=2528407 RepID=A0AAV9X331_9PEZI